MVFYTEAELNEELEQTRLAIAHVRGLLASASSPEEKASLAFSLECLQEDLAELSRTSITRVYDDVGGDSRNYY